jgi:hypothetical protein
MIKLRDRRTGELFDAWGQIGAKRRDLLDRGWAGIFRQHLLERMPIEELAQGFSFGMGRPSKDLTVVLGALILQQMHDLTDAATVEAIAFNLAWHYALDIRTESDAYICERTLRNYRRKVIEKGLDEVLFRGLTDRLIEAFGVEVNKQRLDSTAVRSAMRTLTRLQILAEGLTKFLRELERFHPRLYKRVDEKVIKRYISGKGGGCFDFGKPSDSKRRLPEAVWDIWEHICLFEKTTASKLSSFAILKRIFDDHVSVEQGDDDHLALQLRYGREIPCDSVQNPADPDASYNAHHGQGYLVQIMESYQEDDGIDKDLSLPDIITHVAVGKMTEHDSAHLAPAIEDTSSRDIAPDSLAADSHYGSIDNVVHAATQGVDLVAPALPPKGYKKNRLTLEKFDLDHDGLVCKCPVGQTPYSVSAGSKRIQARFEVKVCESCQSQDRCPTRIKNGYARLQYTHERLRQCRRRRVQDSDEFRDRYRWRAGIEATMSRLKYQVGLASLRVRGMAAVKYAVCLRALGLNVFRCAAAMKTV